MTTGLAPTERARTAAALGAVLGLAAMGFGGFALVLVGAQRLLLSSLPAPVRAGDAQMLDLFDVLHGAWLVHMPIWIVVGALLLATGLGMRRGALGARWHQLACVLATLELGAYGLHVLLVVLPAFERLAPPGLPVGALGGAGVLVSLLFALPFLAIAQLVGQRAPSGDPR